MYQFKGSLITMCDIGRQHSILGTQLALPPQEVQLHGPSVSITIQTSNNSFQYMVAGLYIIRTIYS